MKLQNHDLLVAYIDPAVMWHESKGQALAQAILPFLDSLKFQRTVVLGFKAHDDGRTFMNSSNGVGPVGVRIFSDTLGTNSNTN